MPTTFGNFCFEIVLAFEQLILMVSPHVRLKGKKPLWAGAVCESFL